MAEVLGRYSKLGPTGVRVAKATEVARSQRRMEPWVSPKMTVTRVRRMAPEDVEAMVTDYRGGVGSWRLARKYGVSDSTVLARLKAAGVEIRTEPVEDPAQVATVQEMARLRDEGWTLSRIGERFGITRQTVAMRLRRQTASSADSG